VKIRLEFVFNRCEKRISVFDRSLGNAVEKKVKKMAVEKKGEISDR